MGDDRPRLLLVDDDPIVVRSLARVLSAYFVVSSTTRPEKAVERLLRQPYDALVTDFEMPRLDGAQLIARVRAARGAALPIIVLTGTSQPNVPGADMVIHKPADSRQIVSAITELIRDKARGVVA